MGLIVLAGAVVVAACETEECDCNVPTAAVATGTGGGGGGTATTCDVGDCEQCQASSCAASACQEAVNACDANVNCKGFQSCIQPCADPNAPITCAEDCDAQFPGGAMLAGNVWFCTVCESRACYADCGGEVGCQEGMAGAPPMATGPTTTVTTSGAGGMMTSTVSSTAGVGGAGTSTGSTGGAGGMNGAGGN